MPLGVNPHHPNRSPAMTDPEALDRMRDALGRIEMGCVAVLLIASLSDDPINPDVLKAVLDDARAGLGATPTRRDNEMGEG